MEAKILVVGAIEGHFQKAFQKISKLNAKTNFAFVLVVGDLFANYSDKTHNGDNNDDEQLKLQTELESLVDGKIPIPIPVYFSIGNNAIPLVAQEKLEASESGELCRNLCYLGRKGTLTTSEGIRIVALGGRQVQPSNEEALTQSLRKYDPLYLENEARALYGAHSAHVLLTNQWPADITHGSNVSVPEGIDTSSSSTSTARMVANLCATLKPRYHFASSPSAMWSREPFLWPVSYETEDEQQQQSQQHNKISAISPITRFTSLASVQTTNKEWMSAFTLDPTKPPPTEGAQRAAPFTVNTASTSKRKRPDDGTNRTSYRYDDGHGNGHPSSSSHHFGGGKRGKRQKHDPNDCFMCLGKPQFDADMVVSIGNESFMTVLKGSLPEPDTFPQLESSGNVMIIPMYHAADEAAQGARAETDITAEFAEMNRYRAAIGQMLSSRGKGKDKDKDILGAVCWEVNRTGIRHFHWQLVACPRTLIEQGYVATGFKMAAEKNQYDPFVTCAPDERLPDLRSDYFRVWIWCPQVENNPDSISDPVSDAASAERKNSTTKTNTPTPIERADAIANGHDDDDDDDDDRDDDEDKDKDKRTITGKETSMYFPIHPRQRFNIAFGREVMAAILGLEHRSDWRQVPVLSADVEKKDAEAFKRDFGPWDFAMM